MQSMIVERWMVKMYIDEILPSEMTIVIYIKKNIITSQ